jgi:hypothetical protein
LAPVQLVLFALVATLAVPASSELAPTRRCTHVSFGFRACTTFYERKDEQSAIYRHTSTGWTKVVGGPAHSHGWWRRVVAAPDRKTLLAQWSGECELQSTYVVSSTDGRVRAIFPGHSSTIAGWSHPGLPRVRLNEGVWRKNVRVHAPGIYLVNPKTLAVSLQSPLPPLLGC